MAIPKSTASLGRTVLRRAATQSRNQAWKQTARRHASTGTASAEKAKKTSDIPWLIGSVAFTVPAAVWLLGQGPQKSDHHGAHHEEAESKEEQPENQEEEAPAEESSEDKSEGDSEEKSEDKSESKSDDDKKDEGDDQKSEGSSDEGSDGGDGKETPDTSGDDDEYEKPGPNAPGQINYKSSMKRGPGENQKGGERAKSETSGEKNSASDKSGAKHPYLDDDEKSKKGEGLKETQKIHGTPRPFIVVGKIAVF